MRTIKWCLRLIGSSLRVTLVAALSVAMVAGGIAIANNYNATVPGSGTSFASVVISTVNYAALLLCDATAGESACATVKAASTAAAQTDTAVVVRNPDVGTVGDSAWVSGNGTAISVLKNIANGIVGAISAGTNMIGYVGLQSNTTGGCTWSTTYMTGSANNATLISTGAHTLCGFTVTQLSTTAGYLRWYDSSGSPTCSSASGFVGAYPVQSNATSPGLSPNLGSFGMAFANGLAFCFTGANGNNDNTSWGGTTNNVILAVGYK